MVSTYPTDITIPQRNSAFLLNGILHVPDLCDSLTTPLQHTSQYSSNNIHRSTIHLMTNTKPIGNQHQRHSSRDQSIRPTNNVPAPPLTLTTKPRTIRALTTCPCHTITQLHWRSPPYSNKAANTPCIDDKSLVTQTASTAHGAYTIHNNACLHDIFPLFPEQCGTFYPAQ
jgi:hypothetical protein